MIPPDKPSAKKHETLVELGKFYFLNGKYKESLKEFEKALEINEKSPDIHYHMGLVYESQNNRDLAQDAYELALKYDPKHKLARKHLNKLIGLVDSSES
jgi:Tfp pilus assembly protein PilF